MTNHRVHKVKDNWYLCERDKRDPSACASTAADFKSFEDAMANYRRYIKA